MKTEIAKLILNKYGKKNPPAVQAGDTVRVHQKIKEGDKERIQVFEGLVIAVKHGQSLDGSFTVRKIATGGVGVERTYPIHSPNVVKVERVKTAEVARAKLYYMRNRLGKAARFKNEYRNPMVWTESAVQAEVEEAPSDEQDIAQEEMIEAVEGTTHEQAEAIVEGDEEKAQEAAEQVEEVQEAVEAQIEEEKAETEGGDEEAPLTVEPEVVEEEAEEAEEAAEKEEKAEK